MSRKTKDRETNTTTVSRRRTRESKKAADSETTDSRTHRSLHGSEANAHNHLSGNKKRTSGSSNMEMLRFTDQFKSLLNSALELRPTIDANAILLLLECSADWKRLRKAAGDVKIVVAADTQEQLEGADEEGFATVCLQMTEHPVYERLSSALLEAVADDLLPPGSCIISLFSGFDADTVDSLSVINLDEHLNRLTVKDLRQLETSVPLLTLKTVVDLAVEIGRDGREGKPVGTLIVVGDSRKTLGCSYPAGFDPVKGYNRKDRKLSEAKVREGIKEIAQLDGAIIVSADGTVEAACRYIDCSAANVHLSKGLGARHWAAAAVSRATNAIAVAVSQSNGTVRIFQNGEVVLRIEPSLRRPVVWKGFDYEQPVPESKQD